MNYYRNPLTIKRNIELLKQLDFLIPLVYPNNIMICNTCNNSGQLTSFNGKDFYYYCKGCKEEIPLTVVSPVAAKSNSKSVFYDLIPHNPQHCSLVVVPVRPLLTLPITFFVPDDANLTIQDWLPPIGSPLSRPFMGVLRSLDPWRLSGISYRVPRPPDTVEETLCNCLDISNREGNNPKLVLLPLSKYNQLGQELAGKANLDELTGNSGKRYSVMTMLSLYGKMSILLDDTLAQDEGYVLTIDTWNYNKVLTCDNPGANLRISF